MTASKGTTTMLPFPNDPTPPLEIAAQAAAAQLLCERKRAAELVEELRAPLLALAIEDGAAAGRVIDIAGPELSDLVAVNLYSDRLELMSANLESTKAAISRPRGSFVVDGRAF